MSTSAAPSYREVVTPRPGEEPQWTPEQLFTDRRDVKHPMRSPPPPRDIPPFPIVPNRSDGSENPWLTRTRKLYITAIVGVLAIIAIAVAVPLVLRHKKAVKDANAPVATSGTSGSVVVTEDGTKFTYINDFGGEWRYDPTNPFGPGGQPQNWSKSIDDQWIWGRDVVRGVNLGGWLVTQPYAVPSIYEKFLNAGPLPVIDEWSLSLAMGDNLQTEMEQHYSTFITEQDFADIAGAGLNWVRIPIGYWAIETQPGEPFLAQVSWKYFLKAIQWARKYGLRICLDVHGLPGSQNGWDHSGRRGVVNMMRGVMGFANAQRSLNYLRTFAQFISQKQYSNVVPVLGIANDVRMDLLGEIPVKSFYLAAYNAIRKVTGTGAGNGPYIAIHEAFRGVFVWQDFLQGADRLALDQHPSFAFNVTEQDAVSDLVRRPCDWAVATNHSSEHFGITLGGQFNGAVNDCGLWITGIGSATTYTNCTGQDDYTTWTPDTINTLKQGALAGMDALQNWFFWTWRIGNSTALGRPSSPLWHYQLGLAHGWIPKDPRDSAGHCGPLLNETASFDGGYPAYATGGDGAGTIVASQLSSYPFPPTTFEPGYNSTQISLLPTYTATGSPITLPGPTFTSAPFVDVGSGWFNAQDNDLYYVPVPQCTYRDPWNAETLSLPTAPCTAVNPTAIPTPGGSSSAPSSTASSAVITPAPTFS
ncbi:glycoside hydrolase [Pluteus cervinus]|uniref:Glycoside hydrolase n=1 Tax=Pluteus cervinus TaxID=181527 RepID=A0ACD3ADF1_9AGAR|nr:glycoside hydrolase [Pluteus cervinus]